MAENPILAVLTTLVTNHEKGVKKRKKQRKKMQATIIKYVKNQRKCIIAMLSAINAAVEREFWVEPTSSQIVCSHIFGNTRFFRGQKTGFGLRISE